MNCIKACDILNKIKTDLSVYLGNYIYEAGLKLPAISIDPPNNDHKTEGCEVIIPFLPKQKVTRSSCNNEIFREQTFCIYVVRHDNKTETLANFENLVYFISQFSQQCATVDYLPMHNSLTDRPQARICLFFDSYD